MSADLLAAVRRSDLIARVGRLVAVRGATLESSGPSTRIGEECRVETSAGELRAEVVGFNNGRTILMPYGEIEGVAPGARVTAAGRQADVGVGMGLIGRVIDAFGAPLDGKGAVRTTDRRRLRSQPPTALSRRRIQEPLSTGVKVIDTALTLAKGQRVGLFAGSGVGKSSLLSMIARGTKAQVKVVALVGERSREVREFVEDHLGPEGLEGAVVVVATASLPAIVRLRAAYAATAIAEFFRDEGLDVLLIMDSLTRFAMARREVGLAAGEPPTTRGYTPSVFTEIPELCERAGLHERQGSITGVYSVLVEGDDLQEPLSDAMRSTLDGHIVLSRDVANEGRYPAVDLLRSISRMRSAVTRDEEREDVRTLVGHLSLFERNRQLIEIGAYKSGINVQLDRVVAVMPRVESFLSQASTEQVPREQSVLLLRDLMRSIGAGHEAA
jgi:flagellum-specific ATP synthase